MFCMGAHAYIDDGAFLCLRHSIEIEEIVKTTYLNI